MAGARTAALISARRQTERAMVDIANTVIGDYDSMLRRSSAGIASCKEVLALVRLP